MAASARWKTQGLIHVQHLSLTLERRSRVGRWSNKYSIDGRSVFSEFTQTPKRTTENTVEKETVKIADKQITRMKSYTGNF